MNVEYTTPKYLKRLRRHYTDLNEQSFNFCRRILESTMAIWGTVFENYLEYSEFLVALMHAKVSFSIVLHQKKSCKSLDVPFAVFQTSSTSPGQLKTILYPQELETVPVQDGFMLEKVQHCYLNLNLFQDMQSA